MKKADRVAFIHKKLNQIYPKIPVPLNHKNKFELLIAVLLSAQCTDERVNQVTPLLFKKANYSNSGLLAPSKYHLHFQGLRAFSP